MTTYTDSIGFNKGEACYPAFGGQRWSFVDVELDLPAIVAARAEAGVTALAAADVLQVIPVPANTLVVNVGVQVTTVEGEAATIDVGDGDTPSGYFNDLDYNALSHTVATGKFYSTADTIDVLFNTATPTLAVFRVWALMLDCNAQ